MKKTYTVIMREGGEIVAKREYTNKKSAVDMGIWYLTQRLAYNGRDAKFIKEAAEAGFVNLKGHKTVGGMRASMYNAMPIEGVEKLVAFMEKFEKENA